MNEVVSSLKIKRSKSPQQPLDQTHLDSITTLNDKVIWDAFKDKDISTCFSLLGQLEHEIKVAAMLIRTANTALIPAVGSISTTTCSYANTTWPSSTSRTAITRQPGYISSGPSGTTKRCRALSPTEKKI